MNLLIGWPRLRRAASLLPSRERQRVEPLWPGLAPWEEGVQVAMSKCVCVQHGVWNDRRARQLPKQLWLWIAPTISASLSERSESLLPWEAWSLGLCFIFFFNLSFYLNMFLSGGWWFLDKRVSLFKKYSKSRSCVNSWVKNKSKIPPFFVVLVYGQPIIYSHVTFELAVPPHPPTPFSRWQSLPLLLYPKAKSEKPFAFVPVGSYISPSCLFHLDLMVFPNPQIVLKGFD